MGRGGAGAEREDRSSLCIQEEPAAVLLPLGLSALSNASSFPGSALYLRGYAFQAPGSPGFYLDSNEKPGRRFEDGRKEEPGCESDSVGFLGGLSFPWTSPLQFQLLPGDPTPGCRSYHHHPCVSPAPGVGGGGQRRGSSFLLSPVSGVSPVLV